MSENECPVYAPTTTPTPKPIPTTTTTTTPITTTTTTTTTTPPDCECTDSFVSRIFSSFSYLKLLFLFWFLYARGCITRVYGIQIAIFILQELNEMYKSFVWATKIFFVTILKTALKKL